MIASNRNEMDERDYKAMNRWKYEDYSIWSKQLAKNYSKRELEKQLSKCEGKTAGYQESHLNAIKKTTSMQGNSQARAHSRNSLTANTEKIRALRDAIELHEYYPEKLK